MSYVCIQIDTVQHKPTDAVHADSCSILYVATLPRSTNWQTFLAGGGEFLALIGSPHPPPPGVYNWKQSYKILHSDYDASSS